MTETMMNTQIALTAQPQYDSDSHESSISRSSVTMTQTQTYTNTQTALGATAETIGGNPKNWEWEDVQKWLNQKGFADMIPVFEEGATDKAGTDGDELLQITLIKMFDTSGAYNAGEKLDIGSIEEAESSPFIDRFFRELTKLQLRGSADFTEKEASINDVVEMKRRIHLFIEKWDRILWIDGYFDTNGKLPTPTIIAEELGVSLSVAEVYLHYHEDIERLKTKDTDELLLDFNVYNDCVIWWFVIVQTVTTIQTKAIWILFNKVAELTPGNVAIELLDKYKFDLTRFAAERLEQLGQNIVIGSQYPVCAALRMCKWFLDIADYDVARGHLFESVADSFVDAAVDYLDLIDSDHMATILLEVKSDIEGMNALDMAMEFELTKFVANQRVERVTTSIMNDFEFLRPINKEEAFQIDPLSTKLIFRKLFYSQFYFTPLGTYVTEVFLYFLYLTLFTYLSVQQFRVFDEMSSQELVFWIFNAGYVANELQMLITYGVKQYYSETQNYFDTVVSLVFIASITLRLYALSLGPPCETAAGAEVRCWATDPLNTAFVILWGIATITLWLRIVNFFILSHSLGPMVTMIFKMMGDIGTFFQIMIVLFIAFAMSLMFLLGDVMAEFENPVSAGVTLFRALLGDFEFDALEDLAVSGGILIFAYGVMLVYLVVGSLVLLNLLIAMMAKTFDTIEEQTTAAIIFARYTLALDRDTTASYMPPPLNVPVMAMLLLFYLIDSVMNAIKRCVVCCCCRKKEFVAFDLSVYLMPSFMRERKLEIDDQILYQNCKTFWTITTNKGPTKCKIVKYKGEIGQHYVRFYNDQKKGIKVSVGNSVEKKHQWQLDLFDLNRDNLIDFKQFDSVWVDATWTHLANQSINEADDSEHKSPYWICGFCRGYVKASKISAKRLGYMMNVGDIEMKIVTKVAPEICPNCYRVRLERSRFDLVWEILSYWTYKVIVAPMLFLLFGILILFSLLQDLDEFTRAMDIVKSRVKKTKDQTLDVVDAVGNVFDDDADADEDEKEDKHKTDPRYVAYHYADTQLISNMNEMDENETMFDVAIRNDVWGLLAGAKDDIDVYLLREKINNHIMSLSTEDELTRFEFFDDFINMEGLKKNGGDFLWREYFAPLALTIFERVQKLRNDFLPLHLFKRYPFDLPLVLDDFAAFFDEKEDFNKQMKDLSPEDIMAALDELQPLNCINDAQRVKVIRSVQYDKDDVWMTSPDDCIFDKFVRYMQEVQAMFQDTRTIKNMLRDVSTAIVERGSDSSVFRDQIHFLFEDIRNVTLATPFFNSMRTEIKGGELKVELWTIRNTLYALYFLSCTVRMHVLRRHARIYIEKQGLLNMVYKAFVNEIIDPEGITSFIYTSDNEEEDGGDEKKPEDDMSEDEMDEAADMKRSNSMIFAQQSTVALGILQGADDDDEMDEEERHRIVVGRMELFQKDAITASAVRDEVSSIFDKIQHARSTKITETTIDYYRRNGLGVRLLQDDETLRFIFEQLSRYATFYPKHMKNECTVDLLKTIFYETLDFGVNYRIDDETIPKLVRNDHFVEQLYDHLNDLYTETIKEKFNSIIIEQTLECMTLEDVLSMIMLYERTFSTLNTKIVEDGDTFVATHDVFCKFVDPKGFDPDTPKHEWTNKTVAASDLFQSVLDEQQNFVTLGQIRQTIDKLMKDIAVMKCGELTRIMNHLNKKFRGDNLRCKNDRVRYVSFCEEQKAEDGGDGADELTTQLTLRDDGGDGDDDDDAIALAGATNGTKPKARTRPLKRKATMKNPGLSFKHISKSKWTTFVDGIAANFKMNVLSKTVGETLHDEEHKELEEKKYDDNDSKGGTKQIIESILDNTSFDIIKTTLGNGSKNQRASSAAVEPVIMEEQQEEKEEKTHPTKKKKKSAVAKKRAEVFDTVLSFCAGRITLQQLFTFSKHFNKFLRNNAIIHELLTQYEKIINSSDAATLVKEISMKRHRISPNIETFKAEYFAEVARGKDSEWWDAEIHYLFLGCENRYDLCHKIYPFWSGSILADIYSFMESTEQIQGNYELKEAEFGQLKHSLNVNDELAIRLFHIIRFKIRTLSWKQIYNYFKFLLKMKYNVQRAILKSKQAEDTTVSLDGIKLSLKIQLNDESVWLFNKVDSLHGAKVTWKQIRKYLKKMITVRDEMRDFFRDNARDREYEEQQAEIVNAIHDNVEATQESCDEKQDEMLKHLAAITKQLKELQKEMKSIKRNIHEKKAKKAKIDIGDLEDNPRHVSYQTSADGIELSADRVSLNDIVESKVGKIGDVVHAADLEHDRFLDPPVSTP